MNNQQSNQKVIQNQQQDEGSDGLLSSYLSLRFQINQKYQQSCKLSAMNFYKVQEDQVQLPTRQNRRQEISEDDLFILNATNENHLEEHQKKAPFFKNLHLTPQKLQQLLQKNSLCLSNNKYTNQQIRFILTNPDKKKRQPRRVENVVSLSLNWCRIPEISSLLSQNIFLNLKLLSIGGNFCETIEGLQKVEMPKIQEIQLWKNNLVSTRVLRKLSNLKLKAIDINSNMLPQLKDLRHLQARRLQRFNIESNRLSNINEAVVGFSNKNCKVLVNQNKSLIKLMNKPYIRRRNKAHIVCVPFLEVKYC